MTKLSSQLLTDGILDFEYKKYVVLAYLQHISREFDKASLYPHLAQIKEHYESSLTLQSSQRTLRSQFPRELTGFDPARQKLMYRTLYEEEAALDEISAILDFAIPRFSQAVATGQTRRDDVVTRLSITPIGIVPLRVGEGYLFIHQTPSHETTIYRYRATLYDARRERIVQTEPVSTVRKKLSTTFENMKVDLIRRYAKLPNPAAYMVESPLAYPLDETLLPLAKQLMMQYISTV